MSAFSPIGEPAGAMGEQSIGRARAPRATYEEQDMSRLSMLLDDVPEEELKAALEESDFSSGTDDMSTDTSGTNDSAITADSIMDDPAEEYQPDSTSETERCHRLSKVLKLLLGL